MANISDTLISELESLGYSVRIYNDYLEDCDPKDATELSVMDLSADFFNYNHVKLPKKKLVNIEYVMNKINSDKVYQNFSKYFAKLVDDNSFSIYPTSYGIGVSVLFFSRHDKPAIDGLKDILNKTGIKYSNEYSDAHWVYRFKISKSKENIEKIKQLTK